MTKENINKINKSNMNAILNFIKYQEKLKDNDNRLRKATEMDIFGKINNNNVLKETKNKGDKVASFRMQEEFGPKKRIKP